MLMLLVGRTLTIPRFPEGVHNVVQTAPELAVVREKIGGARLISGSVRKSGRVRVNNSLTSHDSFFDKLISNAVLNLKLGLDQ